MLTKLQHRINTVFSDLKFDSQRHLYFLDNINYPSVSSLVEKHSSKFDAEAILPYSVAKIEKETKEVLTVDELRAKWKKINEDACNLGTETHNFMESFTGIETPTTPQQKAGVKFIYDYSNEYEIVFRELRMFTRKYKYAGTEDLILEHKKTRHIIPADYKTNKDLFKVYKRMPLLAPFNFLEATAYNKIQLQLSYYQIMLEEEAKMKIEDRLLVYLGSDGNYKIYHTYDYTDMLKKYLTHKTIKSKSLYGYSS